MTNFSYSKIRTVKFTDQIFFTLEYLLNKILQFRRIAITHISHFCLSHQNVIYAFSCEIKESIDSSLFICYPFKKKVEFTFPAVDTHKACFFMIHANQPQKIHFCFTISILLRLLIHTNVVAEQQTSTISVSFLLLIGNLQYKV